jgi:uncharacterized protein
LHNLEHFDFYFTPKGQPAWLDALDLGIWQFLFLLFAGKSYAIFALLFGLTFFIQLDNQAKKGKSFLGRFVWRLFLLLCFGLFNSMFYQGDILGTYAIIGLVLVPASYLNNRALLIAAIICLLQPWEWLQVMQAFSLPDAKPPDPSWFAYYGNMEKYIPNGNLWDTIQGNLNNGKQAVIYWTLDSGRVSQTAGLFMLGLLAGRKSRFVPTDTNNRFWKRLLIFSTIILLPTLAIFLHPALITQHLAMQPSLQKTVGLWANLALMGILLSGFVLLFQKPRWNRILGVFSPLGRMSMSNYIIQSMLGSFIYYGWGLGLYQYTGATVSLLIGIGLITLQIMFSRYWLSRHKQGPFEGLWHKLTWMGAQETKQV